MLALVIAGVAAATLLSHSSQRSHVSSAARSTVTALAEAAKLPAPPAGFSIPKPHQLEHSSSVTRWASVAHATEAHVAPAANSRVVAAVGTRTPEGSSNLVDADGEVTSHGSVWVHARLATLPDGRSGWVPRTALGGWSFVKTKLVINLSRLRLTLYRAGREIFHAPVGIGKPGTPTPTGIFYVRDRLTSYASPEYGPLAFGTSARSEFLTDWPAGGFIGIHGTDQPSLIPGRISHGCIRLRNSAILKLGKLLPVGTPVIIQ